MNVSYRIILSYRSPCIAICIVGIVASWLLYLSVEEFTVFQQWTRFNCKRLKAGNCLVGEWLLLEITGTF